MQKLVRQRCSIAPQSRAPQLSILTFNVLADGLAQQGGFIRVLAEFSSSCFIFYSVSAAFVSGSTVSIPNALQHVSVPDTSYLNLQVSREALQWEHRRDLLLAELLAADADIICLQECNRFGA